ncbi:sugar phosphate isomerase/epimerase family protein [Amycolatopsis alkalitolerans]|uniref:sugar phosphate isomerase/epimerase family protein n=1 Tax=Amycolatopsis alkalitolerans TaxID=2547244 RepID=UPI001356E668|nr:sugar phosphate isomerase/epimerase [Amycolatopsis alkalitolerans]
MASLSLDEALDFAVSIGASAVEIAAGGQSSAPHMRVFELLEDPRRRAEFVDKLSERGLRLAAVNCSAWPMHPREGERHVEIIRAAIRLAGALGVDKIVTMSGCPGESAQARAIHWITFPWPEDRYAILGEQWDRAFAVWHDLAEYAVQHGVTRIALELHPLQLVYNVPTLQRMRTEIGPVIGANVDPSHMFWQQMDPVRVVHALGPAIFHVHLKDTEMRADSLALNGVLDATPFADIDRRSWIFRTVGQGHPASFWRSFLGALAEAGYEDVLSIENEDPLQPAQVGAKQAADFITGLNAESVSRGKR